jgi:hypothetical protein
MCLVAGAGMRRLRPAGRGQRLLVRECDPGAAFTGNPASAIKDSKHRVVPEQRLADAYCPYPTRATLPHFTSLCVERALPPR